MKKDKQGNILEESNAAEIQNTKVLHLNKQSLQTYLEQNGLDEAIKFKETEVNQ